MRAGQDGQADQVISQPVSEFVLNPSQISGVYHQLRAGYRFLSDRRFVQQGTVHKNPLLATPKCMMPTEAACVHSPEKRIFEPRLQCSTLAEETRDYLSVSSAFTFLKHGRPGTPISEALKKRPLASLSVSIPFNLNLQSFAGQKFALGTLPMVFVCVGLYGFFHWLKKNKKNKIIGPLQPLESCEG